MDHVALFLELLSAALYNREVEAKGFADCTPHDWLRICNLAKRQGVLALVGERILSLSQDILPERELRLKLALFIHKTEEANQTLGQTLLELAETYEQEDLPFVLLKGFTMARYYPRPKLRSVGDLDIYLYRQGDYQRANQWVKRLGYHLQGESLYEQLYWRGEVPIEHHLHIAYFGIARYDKALSNILSPIIAEGSWGEYIHKNKALKTLPLELDAVYCFVHILHHFSYLGIGFRQVCDWLLLLGYKGAVLDRQRFTEYAEALAVLRPMRLFALMAVLHLGANPKDFPFDLPEDAESKRLAEVILRDILVGGNFGLEHFAGKKFKSIWGRRWYMFRRTTMRSLRVAPISPDHIRLKPLVAIFTRLKLLLGNKQDRG